MSTKHASNLSKNRGFFSKHYPAISKYIDASLEGLSSGEIAILEQKVVANTPYFNESFQEQIVNPRRVRAIRYKIDSDAQDASALADPSKLLGSHEVPLIASALAYIAGSDSDVNLQLPSMQTRDVLLLSSYFIGDICHSMLSLQGLNSAMYPASITLVETDPTSFIESLFVADYSTFIGLCKEHDVIFHLIIEQHAEAVIEILFDYLSTAIPLSLYGLHVISSPDKNASSVILEGWLFSTSGIAQRFLGLIGNTTDEINQLIQAASNHLSQSNSITHKSLAIPGCIHSSLAQVPVLLVSSGPSLDENMSWVHENREKFIVIAAGSCLGSLLRNGVTPDAVVFLERGSLVVDDVLEAILAGFNLAEIMLIASRTVDPRLPRFFKQVLWYERPGSSAFAAFDSGALPLLHAGPEVVNAAMDALLYLGFSNIFMLGCDFCATQRSYPRAKDALGQSPRRLDEPVRSSSGKTVYSDSSLISSANVLDATLSYYPEVSVYRIGHGIEMKNPCQVDLNSPHLLNALNSCRKPEATSLFEQIHVPTSLQSAGPDVISDSLQQVGYALNSLPSILSADILGGGQVYWGGTHHKYFAELWRLQARSDESAAMCAARRILRQQLFALYSFVYDSSHAVNLQVTVPLVTRALEESCRLLFLFIASYLKMLSIQVEENSAKSCLFDIDLLAKIMKLV